MISSPSAFTNSPEYIILDVCFNNSPPLLLASVYRRPKGLLLHDFTVSLTRFSHAYLNIIIAGDLNCNLLRDCFESNYLRDWIYSLSLHLVSSEATFHTASTDSCLDVVIVDYLEKLYEFKKSGPFIAGHNLLEVTYVFDSSPAEQRLLLRRDLKGFTAPEFLHAFQGPIGALELLVTVTSPSDVNVLTNSLSRSILQVFDHLAPIRSFVAKKPPVTWLTEELRGRIWDRNTLYKRAKRSNDFLSYEIYRHVRRTLNEDIKRARSEYQYNLFDNIHDSNKMWKELTRLGLVKSTFTSPLRFFTIDELNVFYVYD